MTRLVLTGSLTGRGRGPFRLEKGLGRNDLRDFGSPGFFEMRDRILEGRPFGVLTLRDRGLALADRAVAVPVRFFALTLRDRALEASAFLPRRG